MYKWIMFGLFLTNGLSIGLVALLILRRWNNPKAGGISSEQHSYNVDQSLGSENSQEISSLHEKVKYLQTAYESLLLTTQKMRNGTAKDESLTSAERETIKRGSSLDLFNLWSDSIESGSQEGEAAKKFGLSRDEVKLLRAFKEVGRGRESEASMLGDGTAAEKRKAPPKSSPR